MAFVGMWMIPLVLPFGLIMMALEKVLGVFGVDLSAIITSTTSTLSDLINQWFETPGNAEMLDKIYTELADFFIQLQQSL